MAALCRISTFLQTAQRISRDSGLLLQNFQIHRRSLHSSLNLLGTLRFSKNHEYLNITDNRAKLGITEHAQRELGDVVFVDLPTAGQLSAELEIGDVACSVESVKAVAEVYMPISGKLTGVNELLESSPELVNKSPLEDGWLIEVEITKPKQLDTLMDVDQYNKFLNTTE